jgi:hypothetical protein
MVNTRRIASAVRAGLTLGACLLGVVSSARALSTSDKPASILVWPKIIVDTSGVIPGGRPTDTIIELGNVDSAALTAASSLRSRVRFALIPPAVRCRVAVVETPVACPVGARSILT